jgi:hypothetical protein
MSPTSKSATFGAMAAAPCRTPYYYFYNFKIGDIGDMGDMIAYGIRLLGHVASMSPPA